MKQEGVNFICGPAGRVAESSQEATGSHFCKPVKEWNLDIRSCFFDVFLQ